MVCLLYSFGQLRQARPSGDTHAALRGCLLRLSWGGETYSRASCSGDKAADGRGPALRVLLPGEALGR
jgi:hypothetical protein